MSNRTPLLVLGLGNVLLEDDGVGVAASALLLERYEPPAGATVLDGGTLGLSLLPYLENAERVILLDAIRADAAPGTFVRIEGEDVAPAVALRLSPHQVGVADLLDGARWLHCYPPHLVLLGLVPGSMELSLGLSAEVQRGLSNLINRVVDEARALGFVFRPRDVGGLPTPATIGAVDVARLSASSVGGDN